VWLYVPRRERWPVNGFGGRSHPAGTVWTEVRIVATKKAATKGAATKKAAAKKATKKSCKKKC